MYKHYHVIGGMRGCIPNINEPVNTLEQASSVLKGLVEQEFDDFELNDRDVTWSADLKYAAVRHGGNEYYEITECEDNCQFD